MADQFFADLNRYAEQLVGGARTMTQENAPTADSVTEAAPSIAVGEPAPSRALLPSGQSGQEEQPGKVQLIEMSDEEAAVLRQQMAEADQIAATQNGSPPSRSYSTTDGSTPLLYWYQPRRYFQGLADDAGQFVRQAQEGATPAQEPSATPVASAPAPMPAVNRRQVFTIQAPVAPSGPAVAQSRRAVVAAAPTSAPRAIYAIGAYFVPENPILPINDYWRQWDQLDKAQAEAKVQELTNLGIPSYYYDGNSWVALYRYA